MTGPWLSLPDAARHCGYSEDYFRKKILKEFYVPRGGPEQNRFSLPVLDEFMSDPSKYKVAPPTPKRKRRKPIILTV